uniref:Fibronectin type-III domain-containing protein n=1 Tax=Hippocampus comes TaxID=109280 RepID=A0A3Q3ECS0_HIPCM
MSWDSNFVFRRQNMKVRINATGDTIVMKFVRPNTDTKLEGYILGYGSSMFSKQFIPLPENGKPYETEFDAEPKYLIAVQPIPTNDVKKHCTGKVELEKPLHLVIGSVTPTSVLLSWGTLLKTISFAPFCLWSRHYTVRYRERNRKWNYQTCPTSDTVIDHLKPNAVYEFGVQPSSKDKTGSWSKPVIHNISSGGSSGKSSNSFLKNPHGGLIVSIHQWTLCSLDKLKESSKQMRTNSSSHNKHIQGLGRALGRINKPLESML